MGVRERGEGEGERGIEREREEKGREGEDYPKRNTR